jgi:hypothetical protein
MPARHHHIQRSPAVSKAIRLLALPSACLQQLLIVIQAPRAVAWWLPPSLLLLLLLAGFTANNLVPLPYKHCTAPEASN